MIETHGSYGINFCDIEKVRLVPDLLECNIKPAVYTSILSRPDMLRGNEMHRKF